jgi:hypothetical protein
MLKKSVEWSGLSGRSVVLHGQYQSGLTWVLVAFFGLGNADSVQTHIRGALFGFAWLWWRGPAWVLAMWSYLGGADNVWPDCGGVDLGLVAVASGLGSATVGLRIWGGGGAYLPVGQRWCRSSGYGRTTSHQLN